VAKRAVVATVDTGTGSESTSVTPDPVATPAIDIVMPDWLTKVCSAIGISVEAALAVIRRKVDVGVWPAAQVPLDEFIAVFARQYSKVTEEKLVALLAEELYQAWMTGKSEAPSNPSNLA
jgi:hypothetical protein